MEIHLKYFMRINNIAQTLFIIATHYWNEKWANKIIIKFFLFYLKNEIQ
jgi:hypothetical protein